MSLHAAVKSVLTEYSTPSITAIAGLGGAGGFSGAELWKIETATGDQLCLRCWPQENPNVNRLEWMHRVLIHGASMGASAIARPLPTNKKKTYAQHSGRLWELSQWKPGVADFHSDSNDCRLAELMKVLANVHMAFAQVQLDFRASEGLEVRCRLLRGLEPSLAQIEHSTKSSNGDVDEFRRTLVNASFKSKLMAFAKSVLSRLALLETTPFPVQPVIKDLWHDHILWTHNCVTGIVDFGAMQMDSVALDLGRLLGSLVENDTERWHFAVSEYSKQRRLSSNEIELAFAVDKANVVLTGIHWLKWLLVEGRHFENMESVQKRIAGIHRRLRNEIESEAENSLII